MAGVFCSNGQRRLCPEWSRSLFPADDVWIMFYGSHRSYDKQTALGFASNRDRLTRTKHFDKPMFPRE